MTDRVVNWSTEVRRVFGDVSSGDQAAAWNDAKQACPIGTRVCGRVRLKPPFGLWLDVGIGFPALLLVTRFDRPITAGEFARSAPEIGDEVSATVFLHNDEARQLVLTQRPLEDTT